jgi:hypothetical protein
MIVDTARTTAATDEQPQLPEDIRRKEAAATQRDATRAVAGRATRLGRRLS